MKKFEPLSQKSAEIMRPEVLSQIQIFASVHRENVRFSLNFQAMGLIFCMQGYLYEYSKSSLATYALR